MSKAHEDAQRDCVLEQGQATTVHYMGTILGTSLANAEGPQQLQRLAPSEGMWHCHPCEETHQGQGSEITSCPYTASCWICYTLIFLYKQTWKRLTSAFSWRKSQPRAHRDQGNQSVTNKEPFLTLPNPHSKQQDARGRISHKLNCSSRKWHIQHFFHDFLFTTFPSCPLPNSADGDGSTLSL